MYVSLFSEKRRLRKKESAFYWQIHDWAGGAGDVVGMLYNPHITLLTTTASPVAKRLEHLIRLRTCRSI